MNDHEAIARHLTDAHEFTMPSDVPEQFVHGLHHGLHVQAGRDRTEDHLHEVDRDQ